MIRRLTFTVMAAMIVAGLIAGCSLPGKPNAEDRWVASAQVMDFNQLYAQNCAGCHGADGRFGSSHPLNDPVYLAVVNPDVLRQVTANGVQGTSMPAFAQHAGGSLTDKQIDVLVAG